MHYLQLYCQVRICHGAKHIQSRVHADHEAEKVQTQESIWLNGVRREIYIKKNAGRIDSLRIY